MSDQGDDDNFIKTTIPLPAIHNWVCKPGNNLFIAERGAVAFEIPDKWVIRHDGKETVSLHDLTPPKDSCRISMTIFHLPPVKGGWSQMPLTKMLQESAENPKGKKKHKKPASPLEIHAIQRPDLELAWADKGSYPDPENGRLIHSRQILARARLMQVLITFDMYKDQAEKFEIVWKDVLRTIRLAVPTDFTGQVGN